MSFHPPSQTFSCKPVLEKTRICQYHLLDRCRYGSSCSFAHSVLELRTAPPAVRKTKLCPLFQDGLCQEQACNFAHGLGDLRGHTWPPADNTDLLLDMLNKVLALNQVSHSY